VLARLNVAQGHALRLLVRIRHSRDSQFSIIAMVQGKPTIGKNEYAKTRCEISHWEPIMIERGKVTASAQRVGGQGKRSLADSSLDFA